MLSLHTALIILLAIASGAPVSAAQRSKKKNEPIPAPAARPVLQPKFIPGEVMRYQVEFQTTSDTKSGGAIQDPEGPSHVVIIWDATVRLEVLGAAAGTGGSAPAPVASDGKNATGNANANPTGKSAAGQNVAAANTLRLRTTYEQSSARVQSDTPDPQAETIIKQYEQIEGRSIEFTLGADGNVSAVSGLEGILSDQNAIQAAQQWMAQLSAGGSAPATVVPGVTWSSEQPADSLPLAGLTWRTDSTYLRDEPCQPALPADATPSQRGDTCAVILMSLTLSPARTKGDATPEEFRRNGLQSSGHWAGSGDNLSYVSLRTGWVVSASQSSTQEMDVNISNAQGATVHYGGTVQTRSQIALLPPQAARVQPAPQAAPAPAPPASQVPSTSQAPPAAPTSPTR